MNKNEKKQSVFFNLFCDRSLQFITEADSKIFFSQFILITVAMICRAKVDSN